MHQVACQITRGGVATHCFGGGVATHCFGGGVATHYFGGGVATHCFVAQATVVIKSQKCDWNLPEVRT